MTGRGTRLAADGGLAGHVPVLLSQVMAFLAPRPGETVIDGTFGAGGYSRALLEAGADVLAIDRDPNAISRGAGLVASAGGRLRLVEGRFGDLDAIAADVGYEKVDGVVVDIGVSSMQLDEAERGFSFMRDGPLDMRMEQAGPSAADVVNSMDGRDLARILAILGEERKAGLIVRAIERARAEKKLSRTLELASLVERAIGRKPGDPIHPATRTFQALRIFVNRELDELGRALGAAERILREGGRLVVVAFHSLEDRIVKRFLAERSRETPTASRHRPSEILAPPTFKLLHRSAVTPSAEESERNPRARSARLRAAVRTGAPARGEPADLGLPFLPELPRG
ncbi:MAG: 16S rRNA (cytosine(1402)-N(4))-methyltransferase RsmH [Bauldia sp.]|nr:16S rRNA (cytosine(1402)-N(4))-methyltransferase RsmH [Bauldia sp.]